MGLTFIGDLCRPPQPALLLLHRREGQFRTLVLGYPPAGYLSKAAQAFSDVVIEILQAQHEELRAKLKGGPQIGR